ncbi:MAG: hypothetical protein IJB00_04580 [Akkermansia sp.]|nr:hypothetical protein [Akkermansia sp.]
MTSTQWVEYHVGTKRKSYNTLPTSDITAEAVTVDGFTLSQKDNAGVTTTISCYHNDSGIENAKTYADGCRVSKTYDVYKRVQTETDARGKAKAHTYDPARGLLLATSCYSDNTRSRVYGEPESDSHVVDNATHLITETRDAALDFHREPGAAS